MGEEIDGNTILARALKDQVRFRSGAAAKEMVLKILKFLIIFGEYKVQLFHLLLFRVSNMFSGLLVSP